MAEPAGGVASESTRVHSMGEPAAAAVVILSDGTDAARRIAEPLLESFRRKRVDVCAVADPYRALARAAQLSRAGAQSAKLAVLVDPAPMRELLDALARYAPGVSCWRYGEGKLTPTTATESRPDEPQGALDCPEPSRPAPPAAAGPPRLRLAGDGPEPVRGPQMIEPRPVKPLRDAILGEPAAAHVRLAGVGELPAQPAADAPDAGGPSALTSEELSMLLGDGPAPGSGGSPGGRA